MNNKSSPKGHNEIIDWAGQVLAQPIISTELIVETHWSSVLKINTPEGCVYLKQTPPDLFIEIGVIEVLREICKIRAVPEIIASNNKLNCFLMKDAGRKIREILKQKFDADLFCKAIDKFTALQLAAAHHVDVLMKIGVPDWRLDRMPDLYRQLLLQKELLIEDGLSEIELSELKALELTVTHLCEKLSSYGIKQTIVQPDFNDNNTVIDEKTQAITVVDLGEIAISHPFFSLLNGLFVIKKHHGLTDEDARFSKIKDACFKNYRQFYSEEKIVDAFAAAQSLWDIYGSLAQYRFMLACGKEKIMSFQHGRLSGALREVRDNVNKEIINGGNNNR